MRTIAGKVAKYKSGRDFVLFYTFGHTIFRVAGGWLLDSVLETE